MIDDKSFSGKVGVVGSGRSIYVISLFLLNIGLARSMGSVQFGAFQQVFMFTALFMIVSMGVPETVYFFLPRLTPEERSGFLGQTLLILGINGILIALVFWIAAPLLAGIQKNPHIITNLKIFGVYGAFLVGSAFADPIFITFNRLKYLFIISASHGLFFIILTGWQYFAKIPAHILFTAMVVFAVCKYMLALYFLYKMRPDIGKISYFTGRHMVLLQLSFALPVALTNTIDIISTWLDKFVISIFFGPEALGVFFVGAIEIPLVGVLLSSVYSVISPILNKLHHNNDIAGFTGLINKTIKFTAKLIWPLCIYLMFFADHLVPLIFKSGYEGSVAPFRIYLLIMPLRIALYGVIIIAIGKPRIVFLGAAGTMVMNLILNLVLVKTIGFLGPAISTVITTYIHVIFLVTYILFDLKVPLKDLIPGKTLFDIGISGVIAAMVAYMMTRLVGTDLGAVISSLLIFFGAYIFLGTKAGFLSFHNIMDIAKGGFGGKNDENSED
ncbi:MAG: oligosaccharide flippase family protein [Candidatus Latescibacteria bacterium]|nr:oligosaccharide flippase family protein [Candidatus Latescibacterota bacterium]